MSVTRDHQVKAAEIHGLPSLERAVDFPPSIKMNSTPQDPAAGDLFPQTDRFGLGLLIALAAIFVWRIFFTGWVNLIPDECSYWTWSRRLDWSYFDNSGMVAYLIRLSTSVFGDSTPFSVRFPFLILSAAGTYLLYRASAILFENRIRAIVAALALNVMPVALLGGSAAIHDNALMFCWIATLWAAARFLKTEDGRWFYVMGLTSGMAILSKYTGVLVVFSLLLFLLWNKSHRRWFLRKEPWLGACIAALFTVPIIWWNVEHDWASLHHILFIGTGSVSLSRRILDGFGYHLAQFLLVSPLFYVAVLACLYRGIAKNLKTPDPAQSLLLSFSFPLFIFGLMAFKGHVEANWAFTGYASAVILAVELLSSARRDGADRSGNCFGRAYLKWGVGFAVVPAIVVVVHAWIGLVPASMEKKLGKADRVIWETRGWEGLGKHVGRLVRTGDVIAGDSYQLCALLEFNVPGNPRVRYLAPWKRPTQFDVWEPSYDNLKGRDIIFVSPRPLDPSSKVLATVYENFGKVERLPAYDVTYHGAVIRRIYVSRGHGFDPFSPKRLGPRSLFYRDY